MTKELPEGEDVELDESEDETVEDTEDGGAIIRMKDDKDEKQHLDHFANIIDEVNPKELKDAVTDLLTKVERDKEAREKRDRLYEEGLRRTGLGDDAPGGAQFSGSTKVVHPMLVEACVDFSARVMKELFPPTGPVKTKLIGERDEAKMAKAERKAEFMNWQTTEQMPEFRGELEQLTTQVPLGGAQYLKLMWSPQHRRPQSEFIAIDDIYLPFAATNFYSAERKTHVQYITQGEYQRRVKAGMYSDVDLTDPGDPEYSKSSTANNKIEGRSATSYNEDGLRVILEIYTHIEFDDEIAPYILSIDKSTEQPLALYRNWEPEDDRQQELDWIVEFPFVPWRGAYPIGLTHMIGGLSGAATGALRALMDSAHIQNIPTLLKLKGGPNGQTLSMQPTEVCEIDGGGMADDIRKLVMALPFPGPSPTLFQLLGFLVDAGKGVVQTSFEKLADGNPNAPVGTTLALIEQGMVVFSSIHSRFHGSMGRVFKILHRINSAYLTAEDIAGQIGDLEIQPSDFDGPMDVVPVSDPSIFSETQRFAQTQAIMQRAIVMPQLYDTRKVEELFLRSLRVSDGILVAKVGTEDIDPVSENVAAAMGQPVYVLPKQEHVNHLKIHMAFMQSPLFGHNPVIAQTYMLPMINHLRDHLLNYYLTESHLGVSLATKGNMITGEGRQQAQMVAAVQVTIEKELGSLAQLLPALAKEAEQYIPKPPIAPDSSMAVAQLSAQVQGQALQAKQQSDAQRLEAQQRTDMMKLQLEHAKIEQASQVRLAQSQAAQQQEAIRQDAENRRTQAEIQARMAMNDADNSTAMSLAAAEINTGERFSVSTGTGINPGTR